MSSPERVEEEYSKHEHTHEHTRAVYHATGVGSLRNRGQFVLTRGVIREGTVTVS